MKKRNVLWLALGVLLILFSPLLAIGTLQISMKIIRYTIFELYVCIILLLMWSVSFDLLGIFSILHFSRLQKAAREG